MYLGIFFLIVRKIFEKNLCRKIFFFFFTQFKKKIVHVSDDFKKKKKLLKKKCSKNLVGFFAEMPLSVNLFRLESSIQKHAGSSGRIHEIAHLGIFFRNIAIYKIMYK